MELKFTPFVTGLPGLPENFLPAAFVHLSAPRPTGGNQVFEMPDFANTRFLGGEVLAGALALPAQFPAAPMTVAAPALSYLGPRIALPPGPTEGTLVLDAGEALPMPLAAPLAIGIIDSGITFWNPAFLVTRDGATEPAFSGMLMQEFSPSGQGAPRTTVLDEAELARICRQARLPGGDALVRADLGQRFPGTVFGTGRPGGAVARAGGLSHGTAMAGLVLEHAQRRVPRLFGCELPLEAVADSGGDTLQCMLALSIRNLVGTIRRHPAHKNGVDIVILVALAFTGGPQVGAHPFLAMLKRQLDDFRDPHLRLVVPRGNHLQDQGRARIASGSGPLVWHLPPGDHSENTLECAFPDRPGVTLDLTAPDGRGVRASPGPGDLLLLKDGGQVIGALWRKPAVDGLGRMRLTLAQTARGAGQAATAQAGDWKLSLTLDGDRVQVDLWLLRDDMPLVLPGLPPRRRSWFRDPQYRRFDARGLRLKTDPGNNASRVLRSGSASLMSCAAGPHFVPVTALERLGAGPPQPAGYAGLPANGASSEGVVVDEGRPESGCVVIGHGGGQRFRLSGTSVAAAIHAGTRA